MSKIQLAKYTVYANCTNVGCCKSLGKVPQQHLLLPTVNIQNSKNTL